jgi:hypothetical protein
MRPAGSFGQLGSIVDAVGPISMVDVLSPETAVMDWVEETPCPLPPDPIKKILTVSFGWGKLPGNLCWSPWKTVS